MTGEQQVAFVRWVWVCLILILILAQLGRIHSRLQDDARYQSCMADVLNSADDSVERMDRCRAHLPAP